MNNQYEDQRSYFGLEDAPYHDDQPLQEMHNDSMAIFAATGLSVDLDRQDFFAIKRLTGAIKRSILYM